jgi:hypothetical protein
MSGEATAVAEDNVVLARTLPSMTYKLAKSAKFFSPLSRLNTEPRDLLQLLWIRDGEDITFEFLREWPREHNSKRFWEGTKTGISFAE